MFNSKPFKNFTSALALINTMVGSAILLLPILYFENGIILSIIFMTCSGFFSFFSCILCLDHLNSKQNYFRDCINRHMKKKTFPLYQICCFLSKEIVFYLYFSIIMKQWKGLLYQNPEVFKWMELGTLGSLIFITLLLRKFQMGIALMALGLLSTVFYCFFILWIFITRPQPENGNKFPLMKGDAIPDLLGMLATAFSTQNVFVQILRKNPHQQSYKNIIIGTYLTGYIIYFFIGVFGGFGLLNRIPIRDHPSTIMDYFNADTWEPFTLYTLYLIHLYSVWPQWSNVNGKRLMALIGIEPTQINTGVHAIISPCLGFLFYKLGVDLTTFIDINGGICLFFIIYVFPIFIHTKCRHFTEESIPLTATDQRIEQQQNKAIIDVQAQVQDGDQMCNKKRKAFEQRPNRNIWKTLEFVTMSLMGCYGVFILGVIVWKTIITKIL